MIWLMMPTIAFASAAKSDYETVLKSGDLAPFKGVLVPEDSYRFYQMDFKELEKCKDRLAAGTECPPCESEMFSAKQVSFFAAGIILGFILTPNRR